MKSFTETSGSGSGHIGRDRGVSADKSLAKIARDGFVGALEFYFEPLTKLWSWWKSGRSSTTVEGLRERLDKFAELLEGLNAKLDKAETPPQLAGLPMQLYQLHGRLSELAERVERVAVQTAPDSNLDAQAVYGALTEIQKQVSDVQLRSTPLPQDEVWVTLPVQIQEVHDRLSELAERMERVESRAQIHLTSNLDVQTVYDTLTEIQNQVVALRSAPYRSSSDRLDYLNEKTKHYDLVFNSPIAANTKYRKAIGVLNVEHGSATVESALGKILTYAEIANFLERRGFSAAAAAVMARAERSSRAVLPASLRAAIGKEQE